MMEHQILRTDNHFKLKVKHIIDNSITILESKISLITNELINLRTEYLDEILKCIQILIK
jgi:hypothetical protein